MMKKTVILICIIFYITKLSAAFKEGNNWNARAAGMGGAYTSLADDASAPLYNPSGLALLEKVEFFFTYFKPFSGVEQVDFNYTYFSLIFPSGEIGNIGLGWKNFTAASLYEEYALLMSYGLFLDKIFNKQFKNIAIGLNVKYLYHSYELDKRTINDPVFLNGKGSGNISFDIGVIIHDPISIISYKNYLTSPLRIGVMVKNINEPDIGLLNDDPVYREFRFGISYKMKDVIKNTMDIIPTSDILYRNNVFNLLGGLEVILYNLFIIRTGGNLNELTAGVGGQFDIKNMFIIHLNYAFLLPMNIKDSYGSHQMSLAIRF